VIFGEGAQSEPAGPAFQRRVQPERDPDAAAAHPVSELRDLARRRAEGLARERRIVESPQGAQIRVGERTLLAFASNDYLGLANAPALIAAARDAALPSRYFRASASAAP